MTNSTLQICVRAPRRKVNFINGVVATSEDIIELFLRSLLGMPVSMSVDLMGNQYFETEEHAGTHPELQVNWQEVLA